MNLQSTKQQNQTACSPEKQRRSGINGVRSQRGRQPVRRLVLTNSQASDLRQVAHHSACCRLVSQVALAQRQLT